LLEGAPLPNSKLKELWKKDYFQTILAIVLIAIAVLAFWFGLRAFLNTDYPMLAVASGSMSTLQPDNPWNYPFVPTLHTGDIIIVQAVSWNDIYANPYNASGRSGDILVFRETEGNNELIVHRAVYKFDNNTVKTLGDGNSGVYGPPFPDGNVPYDQVIGKVVMRIPWVGNLALFLQGSSAVYLIIGLIILILAVEAILSVPRDKRPDMTEQEKANEASTS
jgi:signal peptidase I